MFFLLQKLEKPRVLEIIDHVSRYDMVEDMVVKHLKDITKFVERSEVQNSGTFYEKINDQFYKVYEAIDMGYIFESYGLKELYTLQVCHYQEDKKKVPRVIDASYSSKVQNK